MCEKVPKNKPNWAYRTAIPLPTKVGEFPPIFIEIQYFLPMFQACPSSPFTIHCYTIIIQCNAKRVENNAVSAR